MKTMNKEIQKKMTPAEALNRLMDGNRRIVNRQNAGSDLMEQVQATAGGQYPFAAVLSEHQGAAVLQIP